MDAAKESTRTDEATPLPVPRSALEMNVAELSSVVLARLVDEIRSEDLPSTATYNRTYNRHNR